MRILPLVVWSAVVFGCGFAASSYRDAIYDTGLSGTRWTWNKIKGRTTAPSSERRRSTLRASRDGSEPTAPPSPTPTEQHLDTERAAIEQLIANGQERSKRK